MGVTNQVVAGVLGNIKQESGFCPTNAQNSVYPGIDNSKEYNVIIEQMIKLDMA